jgi:hypothetical protein
MEYNNAEAAMKQLEAEGFDPVNVVSNVRLVEGRDADPASDREYSVEVRSGALSPQMLASLTKIADDTEGTFSVAAAAGFTGLVAIIA